MGENPAASKPCAPGSAASIGVCHIVSGDLWAGAEVQVATLLRHLAGYSELRLSAIVLNSGRLSQAAQDAGIELAVIREDQNSFPAIFWKALHFLNGRNVHVLHSHRYKENLLAAFLAWRARVPFVVRTQHGLPEPHRGYRSLKQGLIQGIDRAVARKATDAVISVSTEMTRTLAQHLDPLKIFTVPNGIDPQGILSRLSIQEAKSRLGIPSHCKVVGTAGRLESIKRLDIFLLTASRIAPQRPEVRFVIAGKGREGTNLQALAKSLNLEDRVLFLGHRDDIYDVLRAFDVLAITSDHEGLPMILLEAMTMGVPVVSRAVGGIPEVIEDGTNGVLVWSADPSDVARECSRVLTDEEFRRRISADASRVVLEKYTARIAADRVLRIYRSLLEVK